MDNRERDRGERTEEGLPGAGDTAEAGGNNPAADAGERARGLAAAGDRAIAAALSQDSARFLAQNRQQSGQ
jgi:hypothetical protein